MDVGVRDLKAHLSKYLDQAEKGEQIRVTERGKPKAILGPIPPRSKLDQGIAEGWIKPASKRPPDYRKHKSYKSSKTLQEILDEDRGE